MRLKVVSALGQSVQMDNLDRNQTTIYDIKKKIEELLGTPIPQQILTFHSQQLYECNDPKTQGIHTVPFYMIQLQKYYSIVLWNGEQYLDAFFTTEAGLAAAIELLYHEKPLLIQYHQYIKTRSIVREHFKLKTYDLCDGDTIYLGLKLGYIQLSK